MLTVTALLFVLTTASTPASQSSDALLVEREVRYRSGELTLVGDLVKLPGMKARSPAVVIAQGSGNSDRTNAWATAIAHVLADQGLIVLHTDKRGCGESEGDWQAASFDDLASDVLAGVSFLRSLPEVDPTRVGVVGLSQGGKVAPVAAARSREVAFVIDISGGALGVVESSFREMANTARQAGLSEEGVAQVLAVNRATARYVLHGDWADYAAIRERGLAGTARSVVVGFPGTPEDPTWTLLRKILMFDPMPYWACVEQPTLVVFGEEDEHDNVPVAESVRRLEHAFSATGKQNATIVVIPGAGHGFIEPGTMSLMPEFVSTIGRWVSETLE